jgi:hypothetical protein
LLADAQAVCDALSIRKQPSLDGSNRNAKAHMSGWFW